MFLEMVQKAIILLALLNFTRSQADICRAPKPSVGFGLPRAYKVGANSFHVPILDYLTDVIGPEFDPPISFYRLSANPYMLNDTVEASQGMGYDIMIAHPYATSCYESEGKAVSLASQTVVEQDRFGQTIELPQYGAVLYTLRNRTDIKTLADVKGKIMGSNKLSSLATHLCYDILLRNGLHHLQDPRQTIYFKNSGLALEAMLRGEVDVGCASTGTLEQYTDPETGEYLDMSRFRILNPQRHSIDGKAFPFVISSPLVPGYQVVAFDHVEESVTTRVQNELLAMSDHASVAPALLECLNQTAFNETPCNRNITSCLNTCFESLPDSSIRNCDTTPQLALKAYDAFQSSGGEVVGFTKPQNNFVLRDIQETTGFLIKDPEPRCVRMKTIQDAVTCPAGHFVRSSEEIVQQCNVSGLPCYDVDCICKPCVKAFEVDFFASNDDQNSLVGTGCAKFSICGTVEQEGVLSFRAIDNRGRSNTNMTGAILRVDETEQTFQFEERNGTFYYNFRATGKRVGQHFIKIRINNEEIPESPFRISVTERDCAAETGDKRKVADDFGHCICQRGSAEINGNCVHWAVIFVPCFLGILLVSGITFWYYRRYLVSKNQDIVWKVKKDEISFASPPKILGSGAYGVVLLGEFRGTKVAVKRVIPPEGMGSFSGDVENGCGDQMEAALSENEKNLKATTPIRDGAVERAARMSAYGHVNDKAKATDTAQKAQMKKLEKDFIEEIKVLSQLRHPNVTTLMGAVLDNEEGPLLIMEYMDLGSLYEIIRDEKNPIGEAILNPILHDVCQGMRFLHATNPPIIHGDLKAKNILVDSRYRAKVADFGLSQTEKLNKRPVGTPYWMAPELLRGESLNTPASDMYSFGVLLYEAYTKKEPFEEQTDAAITLIKVADPSINKRPPFPKTCGNQIRSIMAECFAPKPENRPSFEEVHHRLQRVEIYTPKPEGISNVDNSGIITRCSSTEGSRPHGDNDMSESTKGQPDQDEEMKTADSNTPISENAMNPQVYLSGIWKGTA